MVDFEHATTKGVEDFARYFHIVVANRTEDLSVASAEPLDCDVAIPVKLIPQVPKKPWLQRLTPSGVARNEVCAWGLDRRSARAEAVAHRQPKRHRIILAWSTTWCRGQDLAPMFDARRRLPQPGSVG